MHTCECIWTSYLDFHIKLSFMQPNLKLKIVFAGIIIINNFYDIFWNKEKVQMAKLFPYPMAIFCHHINFSQSPRKCKIENFVKKHQHGGATCTSYWALHTNPQTSPQKIPMEPWKDLNSTLCITWLSENYKFPISLLYRNTRSRSLWLMVENTGNLKLISYLFPFQENACMPCSALGRARKFK